MARRHSVWGPIIGKDNDVIDVQPRGYGRRQSEDRSRFSSIDRGNERLCIEALSRERKLSDDRGREYRAYSDDLGHDVRLLIEDYGTERLLPDGRRESRSYSPGRRDSRLNSPDRRDGGRLPSPDRRDNNRLPSPDRRSDDRSRSDRFSDDRASRDSRLLSEDRGRLYSEDRGRTSRLYSDERSRDRLLSDVERVGRSRDGSRSIMGRSSVSSQESDPHPSVMAMSKRWTTMETVGRCMFLFSVAFFIVGVLITVFGFSNTGIDRSQQMPLQILGPTCLAMTVVMWIIGCVFSRLWNLEWKRQQHAFELRDRVQLHALAVDILNNPVISPGMLQDPILRRQLLLKLRAQKTLDLRFANLALHLILFKQTPFKFNRI